MSCVPLATGDAFRVTNSMTDTPHNIQITGAALVTNLGLSREQTWQSILQRHSNMGPLTAMESALPPGRDGGQAVDLPEDFAPILPREARYLKWALAAALRDAGLEGCGSYAAERSACVLGTTLHGMRAAGRFLRGGGFTAFSEFLAGNTLDLAAGDIPFAGLTATTCSACSSSLGSIALAVTLLQNGDADLVIAGGYDTISEYVYGGFNSLRLVAEGALRPFAKGRQGMKLAEGYGIVVLERAGDAARRGAHPVATILGWGESADAHHLTQPHPQGDGAARAIEQAIQRAGLTPADVDLVAAHATGTPDNDAGEYAAFSRVFGDRLPEVPVVAFKSHIGHTLGGAGAVELILSAMALRDQIVPACANVTAEDVEFPNLRLATGNSRPAKLRTTLNTSLGFGGANTCVILGPGERGNGTQSRAVPSPKSGTSATAVRREDTPAPYTAERDSSRDVLITGIGVILPGITGNDALLARLTADAPPAWLRDAGQVPGSELEGLLNARRVRRMSDYVKLTLAATTLACRDADITDVSEFALSCAAILGSTHGSANYSEEYYRQIINEGITAANPMLFAEAVPNGGAAQLSLMLSLKGACQAVIGARTAGLDAIALAGARIRSGVWDRAIVGAGEEFCELVRRAYHHCGSSAAGGCAPFDGETGFVSGAGAVTFILESRPSMQRRGGKARGRIEATAAARGTRSGAIESARRVLRDLNHPAHVLSSACGTWIDRAEAAAIRHAEGVRTVSAIYGHISETFSASPLVAVAAALLSGKLPRLLGGAWAGSVRAAGGEEEIESFAALCTDFTGSVTGVRVATSA